jgi:hypothetical protein
LTRVTQNVSKRHNGWTGSHQFPRMHQCNCVGCCEKCGTCVTWPAHTPDYCALVVRQKQERKEMVERVVPLTSMCLMQAARSGEDAPSDRERGSCS